MAWSQQAAEAAPLLEKGSPRPQGQRWPRSRRESVSQAGAESESPTPSRNPGHLTSSCSFAGEDTGSASCRAQRRQHLHLGISLRTARGHLDQVLEGGAQAVDRDTCQSARAALTNLPPSIERLKGRPLRHPPSLHSGPNSQLTAHPKRHPDRAKRSLSRPTACRALCCSPGCRNPEGPGPAAPSRACAPTRPPPPSPRLRMSEDAEGS